MDTRRRSFGRAFFLAALMALATAACAPRLPPPAPPPPPAPAPAANCFEALKRIGAEFERQATHPTREGCRVDEAVMLSRATIRLNRPTLMTCPLAHALAAFEQDVVQPAARRHFGKPVVEITHFGSYVCRPQTGRASRLSEHAFGRAIDIGGFEFEGKFVVNIRKDWADRGPKGAFLRDVAQGACRHFNIVLTPKTDFAHANHFHLDIGPYKKCDA
ncbi:MAG: hypothetical protein GC202_06280 [Alphaproteobacteria bacterium]|nr:hypothetical protein [Alphaproteobacteria bacterium]